MDDVSFNLDHKLHQTPPPPPTYSNRIRGVPVLFRHHLNPISRGKYAHYLGYWLPLAITKNTPFPGNSRGIFPRLRPQIPHFPRQGQIMRHIGHWRIFCFTMHAGHCKNKELICGYTGWPRKNATPAITNFKESGTRSN